MLKIIHIIMLDLVIQTYLLGTFKFLICNNEQDVQACLMYHGFV